MNNGLNLLGLLLLIGAGLLYFVPCFLAYRRRHPQANAIMLLNVMGGWLLLPWIAALLWASHQPR